MSDDEADPELLQLLRQRFGISTVPSDEVSPDTNVLHDAEYVYNNAIDVSIDMYASKAAASSIYGSLKERGYSTETWGKHDLHPSVQDGFAEVDIVNFVFTLDLLNFSFWSELPEHERFQVEYSGRRWTGYQSLLACLRRALDNDIPITTPRFWRSRQCSDEVLQNVFRSATTEPMPLLKERIAMLREAGDILYETFADNESDERLSNESEEDMQAPELGKDTVDAPGTATTTQAEGSNSPTVAAPFPVPVLEDGHGREHREMPTARQARADGEVETTVVAMEHRSFATEQPHLQDTNATLAGAASTMRTSSGTGAEQVQDQTRMGPDFVVVRLVEQAAHSAGRLVNLLAKHLPSFRDEARFEGRRVRFLKRAQILVADLWAALNGAGCGEFHDIDRLTMFADYRVPQMLHSLGVLRYSPPLEYHIAACKQLEAGQSWEVQLRGCSIWAVELIRREMRRAHPDTTANAVLIDFFLYDLAKERERNGVAALPHHRVRTQWY